MKHSFFKVNFGRISDKQGRFGDSQVRNIGISCMDKINGPFSLEIDFIAAIKDNVAYEECAYEMYVTPKFIANTYLPNSNAPYLG